MDNGLVPSMLFGEKNGNGVLILVVMEDGLVPLLVPALCRTTTCLNPCCNGRWFRTKHDERKDLKCVSS